MVRVILQSYWDEMFMKRIVKLIHMKKFKTKRAFYNALKRMRTNYGKHAGAKRTLIKHKESLWKAYKNSIWGKEKIEVMSKLGLRTFTSTSRMGGQYIKTYTKWTVKQTSDLARYVKQGISHQEMAFRLGRTVASVSRKITRLK